MNTYLYKGIWNETHSSLSEGGPECASSMTWQYKILVNICIVILNIYIISRNKPDYHENNFQKSKSLIKYIIGLSALTILIAQIIYKIKSGTLLFILNPCHATMVF